MSDKQVVIDKIINAFGHNVYPGFLQGSFDGTEPYEATHPFEGKKNWQELTGDFLDAHHDALHFFSEGGLRFFFPAFLIADLNGQLHRADPLFPLIYYFSDRTTRLPLPGGIFFKPSGRSAFVNPRRYGAMTGEDHARYRLSVFTREEAGAIVAYLEFKREVAPLASIGAEIDAALANYWLERARTAPEENSLREYLALQEQIFAASKSANSKQNSGP